MVANPPAAENRIAERDGCNCAGHVVRCVHFGGDVLQLTDGSRLDHRNPHVAICGPNRNFHVRRVSQMRPCPRCGTPISIGGVSAFSSPTRSEAEAAFEEALHSLLRGEE